MDVLAALVAYLQAPEAVQCEFALPRWRRVRPQRPERPKFFARSVFSAPTDLASAAIDSGRRMGKSRGIQGDKTVKGLLPVRVG
jgi:hypothetical protein